MPRGKLSQFEYQALVDFVYYGKVPPRPVRKRLIQAEGLAHDSEGKLVVTPIAYNSLVAEAPRSEWEPPKGEGSISTIDSSSADVLKDNVPLTARSKFLLSATIGAIMLGGER